MLPLPPTLFYLAQFGFVCFIFLFSSKLSSQLFRNPCDSSISPIYYSTRKCLSESLAYSFPTNNLTQRLSSQHDFISHQVNNIFQRVCRHLPTSGELQFWGLRTQSRYFFSGMATTLQSFIMIRSSCSLQEPSNGIAIFTIFYFSLVAPLVFQTHSREQLCLALDPWDSRKMPTNPANITSSTAKRLASNFLRSGRASRKLIPTY